MSKTKKMIYASFLLFAVCGIILGLVRGGLMFSSPYPAFYILFAAIIVLSFIAAYFVYSAFKSEHTEDLSIYNIPSDWDTLYNKKIQVAQLIGVILILMASVRMIASSSFSALSFVSSVFSFACAVSFFFRIKNKETTSSSALLALFPVFYLCIYLLMFYRSTAKYPNLNLFGPQVLTLSLLVITSYFNAAVKFGMRQLFLRYSITFCTFALSLGDLMAYVFDTNTISITDPTIYLPTIAGFTLFYVVSLLVPPIRVLKNKS